VSLGWFFSVTVRASVAAGQLVLDTSSLPGSQAVRDSIQSAIRDLNDWFRSNGKQLAPPAIVKGSISLTKIDAGLPPS
jgi:hypothetical protein